MLRAFYYSKALPNFQTGSNLCYFDSKGNLFILSKGRKSLGFPVNDVRRAGAQLIELCSPYIKQNLFDQLKRCETKTNLPMLQADLQVKDENFGAKHNEDLELPPKKSFLKEFNAIWNAICDKQEPALVDFTYYTTFLNELFNEDFVERNQSNMLKMKGEDWPLKSVFAARIMTILIDVSRFAALYYEMHSNFKGSIKQLKTIIRLIKIAFHKLKKKYLTYSW